MGIEICTVGGFDEVGRNCTAINIDGVVILCDLGIHLDEYIRYTQDEDIVNLSPNSLMRVNAVPDIREIKDWIPNVRAIVPTHGHIDHIGAIPFLAERFENAEIIGTPYTTSIIKAILKDEEMEIPNEINTVEPNGTYKLTEDITLEFVNITHSIPHTALLAIHTKYGTILYANDFKFDPSPTMGKVSNTKRLEEIGKGNVIALIVESLYAENPAKTPSELVAREMLKEVMLDTESKGKGFIVTTFSSHLARLKSIVEFGKKMNRKIVFLGRSLSKYVYAGQDIDLINFSKDAQIVKYKKQVISVLKKISKNKGKYLLVVTGHQGEPQATLAKMIRGDLPYHFDPEDHVVFASSVIPTEINRKNREKLEMQLKKKGARIYSNVHVSGHASREDLRDLLKLVKPTNLIPAHGPLEMRKNLADLAYSMGFSKKQVHLMDNGSRKTF